MHGGKILSIGFPQKSCGNATEMRCPPEPFDEMPTAWNDQQIAVSDGLIPKLGQLQILSLGGGHTNSSAKWMLASNASLQ